MRTSPETWPTWARGSGNWTESRIKRKKAPGHPGAGIYKKGVTVWREREKAAKRICGKTTISWISAQIPGPLRALPLPCRILTGRPPETDRPDSRAPRAGSRSRSAGQAPNGLQSPEAGRPAGRRPGGARRPHPGPDQGRKPKRRWETAPAGCCWGAPSW